MTNRGLYLAALLIGIFFRSWCFAQDSEARVFFLGIGVEQCINGTPGKPNAVNDVNVVAQRTKDDAEDSRSYNFVCGGKSVLIKRFTQTTLFNDRATRQNIDTAFMQIAAQAKATDILYLYISARSTDSTGSFVIPAVPVAGTKKGKQVPAVLPTREVLLSSYLSELCSRVKCITQIIVANSDEWSYSQDRVKTVMSAGTEYKHRALLFPVLESLDSVSVDAKAGKMSVSWLAGAIFQCESSLLTLLLWEQNSTEDVITDLNITCYGFSRKKRYVGFASVETMTTPVPLTPIASNDQRGTVADKEEGDLSAQAEPIVTIADVKNYALIIANQDYRYWSKLGNPVHDGEDMEKELRDNYGYEVRFVKNIGLDSMHTEIRMLAAKKFEENYQVLFYYAGHGGYDPVTGEGYLVPIDAPDPHSFSIMSRVYTYGTLLKILDNLAAQHVMVMLDACYSGAFNPQLSAKKASKSRGESMVDMERVVSSSMQTKSRCYMTSGKLNQVPDGSSRNSPFAAAILKMLRDNREKGKMTTFAELTVGVMYLTSNPQDGVFGQTEDGDTGEYFFFPVSLLPKKK